MKGKLSYETVSPELLLLKDVLETLGVDRDGLIALSMLVGTDYAPSGVRGIGSKTALKTVKQFGNDRESLFKSVKWEEHCTTPWQEVFSAFKNVPVTSDYALQFKSINIAGVQDLLVGRHEFSEERVLSSLKKLGAGASQKGLGEFL